MLHKRMQFEPFLLLYPSAVRVAVSFLQFMCIGMCQSGGTRFSRQHLKEYNLKIVVLVRYHTLHYHTVQCDMSLDFVTEQIL